MARSAPDRRALPGGPSVPAFRHRGAAPRHRSPSRDRLVRNGGLALRPRHLARRGAPRRGGVRGGRSVPVARARVQQLRNGGISPLALRRGAPRGTRRLARGARGCLRSLVPRGRAVHRGRGRGGCGPPRALHAARGTGRGDRCGQAVPATRGRAPPRRGSRGRRGVSVFRLRRVLRPARRRDARRGARASRRIVGSSRPRPAAAGRADAPSGAGPRRLPRDARAVPARARPRGGGGRGARRAAAAARGARARRAARPLPRARGARRASPDPLGPGNRAGRPVPRALVRPHAVRPRGSRGRRPRWMAIREAVRVAERSRTGRRRQRVGARRGASRPPPCSRDDHDRASGHGTRGRPRDRLFRICRARGGRGRRESCWRPSA